MEPKPTQAPADVPETTAGADARLNADADARLDAFTADLTATFERTREDLSGIIDRIRTQVSDFDADSTRTQVKTWVEENPTIAVAVAVGGGLLLGRALGSAFSPPPPPTFGERIRGGAHDLGEKASSIGEELLKSAAVAGAAIAAGSTAAAHEAGKGARKASGVLSDYATTAQHRLSDLAEDVEDVYDDLSDKASKQAHRTGKQLRKTRKKVSKQGKHLAHEAEHVVSIGSEMSERALAAARTVVAAYVVKKIGDWTGVLR
jgi:ElaB/YqjD/DUF883 family membrane-anchored ribosome-binding protein